MNDASKTTRFFNRHRFDSHYYWTIKSVEEYERDTNVRSKEARKYIFNCLDDIAHVNLPSSEPESGRAPDRVEAFLDQVDRGAFVDLLKRMLALNQSERIVPADALQHKFINMSHLEEYRNTTFVRNCGQIMQAAGALLRGPPHKAHARPITLPAPVPPSVPMAQPAGQQQRQTSPVAPAAPNNPYGPNASNLLLGLQMANAGAQNLQSLISPLAQSHAAHGSLSNLAQVANLNLNTS